MATEVDNLLKDVGFTPPQTNSVNPTMEPTQATDIPTEKPGIVYTRSPIERKDDFIDYIESGPSKSEDLTAYLERVNTKAGSNGVPLETVDGGFQFIKENNQWIQSLYTPQKIAEIKAKGPIGMFEAPMYIYRNGLEKVIPDFTPVPIATGVEIAKGLNINRLLSKRVENPQSLTDAENATLDKYIQLEAEMQLRKFSLMGNIVYYGSRVPKFGVEFAKVASTFGAYGAVLATQKATGVAVKKSLSELTKQAIKRTGQMVSTGVQSAVAPRSISTGALMYGKLVKNINYQYINDQFGITDKGQAFYKEAILKPVTAITRAVLSEAIENTSEMAGAFMFKPALKHLGVKYPGVQKFYTELNKASKKNLGFSLETGVTRLGFDGFVEEFGETRLGEVARVAFGLEGDVTMEKVASALFPSPEQFAIEAGIIVIHSGVSNSTARLSERLAKGKSRDEAKEIFKEVSSLSELDRKAMLNKIKNVETEKDVQEYTQKIQDFKDMVGENVPRETLDANIAIWDNMINVLANKTGKTRSELADELPMVKAMKQGELQGLFQGQLSEGKRIGMNQSVNENYSSYDDVIARERFDIGNLPLISKGGSDRAVHDLGNERVLKVAKTKRGLLQNTYEGDPYLSFIPKVYESGKNYVVTEKIYFDKKRPEINKMLKEISAFGPKKFELHDGEVQDVLNKYGLEDIMNYDVLYGDFVAPRNWGVNANGDIVMADAGTIGGKSILDKDLLEQYSDDWNDIKSRVKDAKRKFGEMDKALYQGAKGAFNAKNNIIALFETADRSTFLHESAHAFFEMYLKHLPTELDTVMKWVGFEGKKIEDLTDKQYVKLQESFASGFELYLREGKAPSMKLADAFESFKEWLTNIYETVQSLIQTAGINIKLNDDIKKFYDEMLAVPADRVATIDENMKIDDTEEGRDLTLFQSIKKKIEEIKQKKKEVVKKFKQKIDMKAEALDFIKGMNVDAKDKVSLLGRVDAVKTEGSFKKVMFDLYDMEQKYWEKQQRNNLDERIKKLLKQTKPAKQAGVTKGKYEYEFNTLFNELREINKLTKEEAKVRLSMETENDDSEGVDLTSEVKLKRLVLGWKAYGKSEATLQAFEETYSALQNAIAVAKESKSEKDFADKLNLSDKKDEALALITKANFKGDRDAITTKIMNSYRLGFADLYGILNSIGGKELADKYALDVNEKDKAAEMDQVHETMYSDIAEEMGMKDKYEVEKLFDKLNQKDFELFEIGRLKAQDISKWEIIDIYNSIKNSKTKESYYKYYGEEQIEALVSNLSESEIALADYLQKQVQSMYDIVNAIHIKQFGVDLGQVENYWPRKSELSEKEPYQEYRQATQISSAQKQRAEGNIPEPQNAYIVANKHIDNAIHQKNLFDKWYEARKVLGSRRVKVAIEDKYGASINQKLKEAIDDGSLNANNQNLDSVSKVVMKVLSNWTGAKILLNASLVPKQAIGAFNYIEEVPAGYFAKYFIEAVANPKKTIDYMFNKSAYVPARFKQGADDIAQNVMKNGGNIAKSRKFTDFMSFFIRTGDAAAVVFGGYAHVKYNMDVKGMSESEAIKEFEKLTIRTQQAGFKTTLAGYQKIPAMKFFTAFKNAQTQMMRRVVNAMIQYNNGEINKGQLTKTMGIYLFAQPALFGLVSALWRAIVLGKDEDEESIIKAMLQNIFTNPLSPIPVIADLSNNFFEVLYGHATGNGVPFWAKQINTPLMTDAQKLSFTIADITGSVLTGEDIDFEDMLTGMQMGLEIGLGLPVGNVIRTGQGIMRLE